MSTVTVISGIVVLLAALVCYAFVSQTIAQKREQRKRMLSKLKNQARGFKFMLNGCPDGFLPKELLMLIQRSLIDVTEQLSKLEPGEAVHAQELQTASSQLANAQREQGRADTQQVTLSTAQQIKDVKMSLEELHRFVFNLEGRAQLNRNQADAYRSQIKQLVLQATVDGYVLQGQTAQSSQKTKLAMHYFDLARQLMQREGHIGNYQARITQVTKILDELEQTLQEEIAAGQHVANIEEENELEDEWSKFENDSADSQWKKKQIYD
ncbi:hypothetical protein [Agaribacterium haliotis]|uniref:hypothetical protein n=1 Tax=Agaribacterium haliotis TaxID=2013869 RepID=UPI000BB55981|nr:hypothetical protein [Agaribacterium haliotis]